MVHAMGVRMVVDVVSGRRGKKSFQDHQKILSTSAEACLPGRKGKLTMLLVARRNQQMASTTGGGRLKRSTGLPVWSGRRVLSTLPPQLLSTTSAGTQLTIPMGFGVTLAPAQPATAMCQSATLLSQQGTFLVQNGLGGGPIGNGTMKYQTHARVSLNYNLVLNTVLSN